MSYQQVNMDGWMDVEPLDDCDTHTHTYTHTFTRPKA